jgi:hypothetical protein
MVYSGQFAILESPLLGGHELMFVVVGRATQLFKWWWRIGSFRGKPEIDSISVDFARPRDCGKNKA